MFHLFASSTNYFQNNSRKTEVAVKLLDIGSKAFRFQGVAGLGPTFSTCPIFLALEKTKSSINKSTWLRRFFALKKSFVQCYHNFLILQKCKK